VTEAGQGERLPSSVDGLLELAFAGYVQRIGLYLALAAGIFAVYVAIEFAPFPPDGVAREAAYIAGSLVADALLVGAVAMGIAARIAGKPLTSRAVLGAATDRWLPVMGALTITNFFVSYTSDLGALGPDRGPFMFAAPLFWLLWGAMALSGPVAALSSDPPALAIVTGFARAVAISLRLQNLARLCLVAFAAVVPLLLGEIVYDLMHQHGIGHALFWANAPIDALATGPLAALQTVFALDFARRGRSTSSG